MTEKTDAVRTATDTALLTAILAELQKQTALLIQLSGGLTSANK